MTIPKSLTLLTTAYLAVFIFASIAPISRAVWIAEITPVLLILVVIWLISAKQALSNTAYVLCFIWLTMHTIGAKYTFANVPFDWFNDLIGSQRNQYDRVAHYSIGFYAYLVAELLLKNKLAKSWVAASYALFSIMSLAAAYEIIEWWYAELAGGEEGIAFLGSQGDIWDAQKDMLCDTLGAITALLIMAVQCKLNPQRFKHQ